MNLRRAIIVPFTFSYASSQGKQWKRKSYFHFAWWGTCVQSDAIKLRQGIKNELRPWFLLGAEGQMNAMFEFKYVTCRRQGWRVTYSALISKPSGWQVSDSSPDMSSCLPFEWPAASGKLANIDGFPNSLYCGWQRWRACSEKGGVGLNRSQI